ncbi:hypothetical protein [Streptomyces sp. H62]
MNGEWLIRGRDGRLSVYQLSNEAVLCRAERAPGGPWEAPRKVGGDQRLLPGPATGQGADAYVHLVSWLPTASGEPSVAHSTHFRPLLAALDWEPLGHPNDTGDQTGTPAVAVDAQGRAHIFLRNRRGGLSMRAQKQRGGWGPWRDLGGQELQDVPVAAAGKGGRMEVYATAPGAILHWRQETPGVKFELVESVATAARPGTLRALATSPERTTVFFTDDASGDLCAWRPGEKPMGVVATAGPGPVSAVRCKIDGHDCTVVAQRSATSGRVAFAAYPSERETLGAVWTESGPELPADTMVSLALDVGDRLVAATFSPSTGELRLTRRKDEPGLALGPWQTV